MIVNPSVDQILEGVLIAMEDEIVPAIGNPKAFATAQMVQSMIQGVRQILPVFDERVVAEHNEMMQVLQQAADVLAGVEGEAAERIRARGAEAAGRAELPAPFDRAAAVSAHTELGRAIEASFVDLDELQRAGESAADEALQILRGHLGPRYLHDARTIMVGDGFVGRS